MATIYVLRIVLLIYSGNCLLQAKKKVDEKESVHAQVYLIFWLIASIFIVVMR